MIRAVPAGLTISAGLVCAACATDPAPGPVEAIYGGIETRLLDGNLVEFRATMQRAGSAADVKAYMNCAAAQYALIRGYGFTRHLRTNIDEKAGVWTADAVYTISPSLPRGLNPQDAEVVVQACAENGIPTV